MSHTTTHPPSSAPSGLSLIPVDIPDTHVPSSSTTSGLSSVPADILDTQILTRLDGPSLASATCASTLFSTTHNHHHLWSTICHSTWPSTTTDYIADIISTFSDNRTRTGYYSFFSQSFPLPTPDPTTLPPSPPPPSSSPAPELISTVDIHYRNIPIFTKTKTTTTTGDWFQFSPFRIDLINPKNVFTTPVILSGDATCPAMMEDVTLSWILIDRFNKRSVNLSSIKPVSVNRHWLSGEVQLRFGSILAGDDVAAVECRIVVVSGVSENGNMQLREVVMEIEGMDGKCLDGRGTLGILHRVMEGKRGNGVNKVEEGRRRYRRYEEMKRESRERRENTERKSRVEGTLDVLCLVFWLCVSIGLFFVLIVKKFILKRD
ncbi:putative F-box-like domain superfamily protein [Helianthus annuus]|nr:putative F-box-like domain superfamily protein [Helianthus annuus]KAJ0686969.1 putative F-box-like domain superfamily protein [Helianthus annuus]